MRARIVSFGAAVVLTVTAIVVPVMVGADATPGDASSASATAQVADGPTIRVVSRQSVTVDGKFASLRDVVARLCDESGIALRSYSAPDRAVEAHYTGVSLREALERLLSQESFVLGVRKKPGEARAKLTWLRVVESKQGGRRAAGQARASVVLPRAAFVSRNVIARKRATQDFARNLHNDVDLRGRFLRAPDSALLAQLGGQPYGAEFLGDLWSQVRHAGVRSKITRLRARLTAAR